MRFGIALQAPWEDDATLLEELGFDLVWIDERVAPAPLIVAGALAATTRGIRIAASLASGPHPVSLAEEAAVADLASGGRLVLVLGADDEELLRETVELLFHAFAARPFTHRGARWQAPAGLPEHERAEARMRVTPAPAQLEPSIWLRGTAGPPVSSLAAIAFVAEQEDASEQWTLLERDLGLAAQRLRRPALVRIDVAGTGELDAEVLVRSLRRRQQAWGMDVAILELPELDARARRRALRSIATDVRPRLQLDHLPVGLEQHWNQSERS
jgi:alkanesulfonate monooxygenase SsuD/methylene tetrahydromethanopterin reductase-like flavin-dependent oxidoreductase (luciferase family)